jgi:Uma2 family endonuclease
VGEVIFAPADIIFSSHRGVQPDVFVLPWAEGNRPKSFAEVGRLLLAAEVLSPSTARADRVTKRKLYREENVPEYWIVDLEAQVFERSTPRDERIEVVADRLEWQPEGASAPLIVDLQRFFDDL